MSEQSSTHSLSTSEGLGVSIRDMQPTDLNFILSSWCKSAYEQPLIAWVPKGTYMRLYHDYIEHALVSGHIRIRVACDPYETSQIFGWLAFDDQAVHYVYVKLIYREQGIGQMLMSSVFKCQYAVNITHHTLKNTRTTQLNYRPALFFTEAALHWMREHHMQHKHALNLE